MIRAVQIEAFGPLRESVKIVEIEPPTPGPKEVHVEVHACSVNPFDNLLLTGDKSVTGLTKYTFPMTLGIDFSGVVLAVGEEVTRFQVGDEVFGMCPAESPGAFAEEIVVPEEELAHKPQLLIHEEAAAIPLVALTSWQALFEVANVEEGSKVFIQAGSGGIGTIAIQLAKHAGAFVATTTSKPNTELVLSLGADQVIDYRNENFRDKVKDFDVVFDTLGPPSIFDSLHTLKKGGKLVSISSVPDAEWTKNKGYNIFIRAVVALMRRKIDKASKKLGVSYHFWLARPIGATLEQIGELIDSKAIKPVIDSAFPFGATVDALEYLGQKRAKGKVIIKVR